MNGEFSLEVYNSIYILNEQNNNFKCYQGYNDRFANHSIKHNGSEWSILLIEAEVLYENIKDGIAMALSVSNNLHEDWQNETTGPPIIKEYEKLIKHDGYDFLLGGNFQAMFQNFESYLKTEVDLAKEDLELIFKTIYFRLCHTGNTSRSLYHWG